VFETPGVSERFRPFFPVTRGLPVIGVLPGLHFGARLGPDRALSASISSKRNPLSA
jgi:hypothetical protein